ncbi:relaxase [Vibrio sinensis]|uniref:Relaxase n=1 Tax=Vibrio sinensis TaxID=2302434 RepID=A0A3A6QBK3_9VIBR|nr:MobH family relaxase [Vibrio sinensis]RJX68699.1 relaxase [Vibrio sinensis]
MLIRIKQLIDWFNDEPKNKAQPTLSVKTPAGFCAPWTAEQLKQDDLIKDKLRVLKRSGLALPYEVWDEFVVDTVIRFAMCCQDLPASESYHHATPRGLLLHSLDVAIYAMRIRRNYILPPNTVPEDVIHKEIVWVYGVFLCALLHDVGKVLDMEIELFVGEEKTPVRWTPALGTITQPYRFRYHQERHYSQHQHSGLMWLTPLLGENPMAAITSDRQLYHEISAYLSGHAGSDSVIGQILMQADAASVAQNLGADKAGINQAAEKARGASGSLAGQLRLTLTHLLQSGAFPLNKKGAEGFVEGEHLFLMSKPIAERLRVSLLERGINNVPSDNSRLFNELQQHQLIRANDDEMAIWKCEVFLRAFDWRQTFTFVCVHWPSIWPEGDLPSIDGSITPVSDTTDVLQQDQGDGVSLGQQTAISSLGEDFKSSNSQVDLAATITTQPEGLEQESQISSFSMDLMSFMPGMEANKTEPAISASLIESDEIEIAQDALNTMNHSESDGVMNEALSLDLSIMSQKFDARSTSPEALGHAFYQWVDAVLKGGVQPVNRQGALFHRLEQGMFVVSPGAFHHFIAERCLFAQANTYGLVQQGLQPLGKHQLRADGRSVHKALIKESDKSLNGFLFAVQPEWADLYPINPHVYLECE